MNIFPSLAITCVEYAPRWGGKAVSFMVPNRIYGYGIERVQTIEEALEIVFRQCNRVDGSELISQEDYNGFRSMSVGDSVTFRGPGGWTKTFTCEDCGWKEVA